MRVKRWMFFHPNDGTVPYPTPSDCDYTVLWERINDLESQVERQSAYINDLNDRLQRYAGRMDPNIVRTETVVSQDIMNSMGRINPVEYYQRENEQSLMMYLREHNYFNHEMYSDYGGETRIRTSLRILDNPN
jgi:hypothetical protein